MRARNHLPKMSDDCINEERFSGVIPIHSPGVGGALADDLKYAPRRMIPPDAAIELYPFVRRRAGFAHEGRALDTVTAIEPTIRAPTQAVDDIVMHCQILPAIQEHLRFTVRNQISIPVRNKQHLRSAECPNAAKAHFDTG